MEAKICCPTFATERSLRRSRDEIACSNSAISRFTALADSILLLADADDATMLENPISLFSFRFPVERNARRAVDSMGNGGIKEGEEEGG